MKKKVIVRGPILTQSGYGEHARFIMRALRSREDVFDIYALPVNWGKTNWEWQNTEERRWLDGIFEKTANQKENKFDLSLQVTIPNEWEKIAEKNIGVTAGIETTAVAPAWIQKSQVVDRIITISEHAKNVYKSTSYDAQDKQTGRVFKNVRCTTPIDIVRYPVKDIADKDLGLDLDYDFNFLVVGMFTPRKNIENTITWFVEEFIDQEVGLVVKTNVMKNCLYDKVATEVQIKQILAKYPNRKCKVYLLHGYMTEEDMSAVYSCDKIKAFVSLAHGEGFGLPIFEAAYHGLPVIAPEWSGHVDYMRCPIKDKKGKEKIKSCLSSVEYTMARIPKQIVWDGVLIEESSWCVPAQGSYKMKLREMHKDYGRFKKRAGLLQKHLKKTYTAENQYKKVFDSISKVVDFQLDEEVNELFDQLMNQG
jgi:glycosyltransferase involved in cell wall biosynthesis